MVEATYVPSNGKTKCLINISGAELRDGTRQRKPCGHLAQALHHSKDGNTSESVPQKD